MEEKSQSELRIDEPMGRKRRKLLGGKKQTNVATERGFLGVMVENGNEEGAFIYAKKGAIFENHYL